ncbi:MAG: outer membrane beta-barrel protein [Agriterribacter sp.]
MKRTLLILFIFFSASSAFSQINKGQFLVGGSGAFSSETKNGVEAKRFTLSPNVGYFFFDKLAGGLDLNFYNSKVKFGTDQNRSTSYGISPFVRYYILPAPNKINLVAEAGYGFFTGKSRYSNENAFTTTGHGYSFSAGPVFFIRPNIALELTAGYAESTYKSKYGGNSVSNLKNKNFQVGVGFQIHLGNGKK